MKPPDLDIELRQLEDELAADLRRKAVSIDVTVQAWKAIVERVDAQATGSRASRFSGRVLRRSTFSRRTLRGKLTYLISSTIVAGVVGIAFNRGDLRSGPPLPTRRYTTTAGQYAMVTLADGSNAQLRPMTTVVVMNNLAERRMDVRVIGEALFTVMHHPHVSFQVHTVNAVARVLGTTFLVRRYPTDPMTRVIVADGRVSLSGRQRSMIPILTTRMLGTVDDSGHMMVTPNIAVDDYSAWTTGRLIFRDAPILDIIAELNRAYNVEFRVSDSLLTDQHLNWTIPFAQQSLSEIIAVLGSVLDAHPVRTGRIITFVPGPAASHRSPHLPSFPPEHQYGK